MKIISRYNIDYYDDLKDKLIELNIKYKHEFIKDIITQDNLNEVLTFFKNLGIEPKIKNGYSQASRFRYR